MKDDRVLMFEMGTGVKIRSKVLKIKLFGRRGLPEFHRLASG